MNSFSFIAEINDFIEMGGPVLVVIFFMSLAIWILILERYIFMRITFPVDMQSCINGWASRDDKQSWRAREIRCSMLSASRIKLQKNLALIAALISLCPLLGLLGTVAGMIHIFDVMTVVGLGNVRAMASGISMATIPTMAALFTALTGIYFISQLRSRVKTTMVFLEKNLVLFEEYDHG